MARTSIPADLVHHPEEVERDAARFENLCRLVEEIALPTVESALDRETISAGAEVLTEEARIALRVLAEDADILEELDEEHVLQEVQKTLSDEIPRPDENEYLQHARDFSQVLTSAWLEILRSAESQRKVVILSDYLVPRVNSHNRGRLIEQFFGKTPRLPQMLIDATGWFAVNEEDIATVMKTLRTKLFSERRVIDLPFDLILAGTSARSAIVLSRESFDRLRESMNRLKKDQREQIESIRSPIAEPAAPPENRSFATATAQHALDALCEPLPAAQYYCLEVVASPKWNEESIEARVQAAFKG